MVANPGGRYFEKRWWAQSGDELGRTVWAIGSSLEDDQALRRDRARESLSLYEGRDLRGLYPGAYDIDNGYQDYDLNISRAAVDTVQAEIAGRQKPIAKFQTSGATWKVKRRAKKLEKFCESVLHQRQGLYLHAWALMEDVFLDAAIWGCGVAKVFWGNGRINIERHFDYELYADPHESRYGDPKNLFHVYMMDRDLALWKFSQDPALELSAARREEIAGFIAAADDVDHDADTLYGYNPRVAKSVKIVEAWRLKMPDGSPGKHVFSINSGLLLEEEWNRDSFPFVRMHWERDRLGWHGKGLVEQGESIHRELNTNAVRLQERFRLCGSKRTFVEDESVQMEDMQANDAEVVVRVRKGAKFPQESAPKPIAESEFAWFQDTFEKYFEITGISRMRATSRKEPGVTAGIAIRTLNDMQVARFSLKARGYENSYVELAQQIIHCAREAAEFEEVTVRYDEEINWQDVDLPENTFDITIAPASSLPNDPAGRLQMAQELYDAGIVGQETFKQLLGWPDLEKQMGFQTSQRNYIERLLDTMLDAGPEYQYVSPDPHLLDKPGAMVQCVQAYFEALYQDAPDQKLDRVRRFMKELDQLIAVTQMGQVAGQIVPGLPPGEAPMGNMPMPGMPPGAPPAPQGAPAPMPPQA